MLDIEFHHPGSPPVDVALRDAKTQRPAATVWCRMFKGKMNRCQDRRYAVHLSVGRTFASNRRSQRRKENANLARGRAGPGGACARLFSLPCAVAGPNKAESHLCLKKQSEDVEGLRGRRNAILTAAEE
jgi:hypothetical protein